MVYQFSFFLHISRPQIPFKSCHIAATFQDSWAQLCLADVKAFWQSNTNLGQLDSGNKNTGASPQSMPPQEDTVDVSAQRLVY